LTYSPKRRTMRPSTQVLRDCGHCARLPPIDYRSPQAGRNLFVSAFRRRKEAISMQFGFRYSGFVVIAALLLILTTSSSAQIRFEDFSNTSPLWINGSAHPATWQSQAVLRLTDGNAGNPEAASVYFQDASHARGVGKQQVAGGFTTWFEFQMHSPTACCNPGDGIAFIIQNSSATDPTYGASGMGFSALGAGNGATGGGMGYAGINNNLAIEFDILQDPWDPSSNHIAIQTCGPATNTPVHLPGNYTIGNNNNVQSCLLYQSQQSIDSNIPVMGPTCNGSSCTDGPVHNAVIGYTPPMGTMPGILQIWLDPTFLSGTHTPTGPATMSVPYNIVYNAQTNPSGLSLDATNCNGQQGPCGYAWVGFTASQPSEGTAQDVFGWEFTLSAPTMLTEPLQPGGTPTVFAFGAHQTTVTYPMGFQPNGISMTVTSTPTEQQQFYQNRLVGTEFSNEQCVVYEGTGGQPGQPEQTGNCIVYSYTCQDSMGNPVTCPMEPLCTSPLQSQCIVINTTFYTMDDVTPTNADYLENDAIGDNNWMSIFTSFTDDPTDGTTAGGSRGFGGSGNSPLQRPPNGMKLLQGSMGADIVATFRPGQP
jgi:Legume lectin domain